MASVLPTFWKDQASAFDEGRGIMPGARDRRKIAGGAIRWAMVRRYGGTLEIEFQIRCPLIGAIMGGKAWHGAWLVSRRVAFAGKAIRHGLA